MRYRVQISETGKHTEETGQVSHRRLLRIVQQPQVRLEG